LAKKDYTNHEEAIDDIADYIVVSHNSNRLHSTLGNPSPNAFERESTAKKLGYCSKLPDQYHRLLAHADQAIQDGAE